MKALLLVTLGFLQGYVHAQTIPAGEPCVLTLKAWGIDDAVGNQDVATIRTGYIKLNGQAVLTTGPKTLTNDDWGIHMATYNKDTCEITGLRQFKYQTTYSRISSSYRTDIKNFINAVPVGQIIAAVTADDFSTGTMDLDFRAFFEGLGIAPPSTDNTIICYRCAYLFVVEKGTTASAVYKFASQSLGPLVYEKVIRGVESFDWSRSASTAWSMAYSGTEPKSYVFDSSSATDQVGIDTNTDFFIMSTYQQAQVPGDFESSMTLKSLDQLGVSSTLVFRFYFHIITTSNRKFIEIRSTATNCLLTSEGNVVNCDLSAITPGVEFNFKISVVGNLGTLEIAGQTINFPTLASTASSASIGIGLKYGVNEVLRVTNFIPLVTAPQPQVCAELTIVGNTLKTSILGKFLRQATQINGRPYYKHETLDLYLTYEDGNTQAPGICRSQHWRISTSSTTEPRSIMYVKSTATEPYLVNSAWQVLVDNQWACGTDYNIQVNCAKLV